MLNLTPLGLSAMVAVMSSGGGGGDGSLGGLGGSTMIGSVSISLNRSSVCLDDSRVRMSGLSSRGTSAVLVGSSC